MQAMTNSSTTASGLYRRGVFLTVMGASVLFVAPLLFPASPAQADPAAIVKANEKPKTRFTPASVTIKVGEEVEWDNAGKIPHRVLSTPKGRPPGATGFDSMFMLPGKKFTHKFTVPGTYHYVCDFHAATGMQGDVVVTK